MGLHRLPWPGFCQGLHPCHTCGSPRQHPTRPGRAQHTAGPEDGKWPPWMWPLWSVSPRALAVALRSCGTQKKTLRSGDVAPATPLPHLAVLHPHGPMPLRHHGWVPRPLPRSAAVRSCPKHHPLTIHPSLRAFLISQRKKQRPRQSWWLVPRHMARKQQSWDSSSGLVPDCTDQGAILCPISELSWDSGSAPFPGRSSVDII